MVVDVPTAGRALLAERRPPLRHENGMQRCRSPRAVLGVGRFSRTSPSMDAMEQHLPKIYLAFREAHPDVAKALDTLGRETEQAGPLDARTQRLVKVALAVGSLAEGAVRSNAGKGARSGRHAC